MAAAPAAVGVASFGRTLPHSLEAERGLLGSLLLDGERVMDLCLALGLRPESFHVPGHRVIFEAMLTLHLASKPVDAVSVDQRLRDLQQLDAAGGAGCLEQVIDATPTPAHADYYAGIVADKDLLRRLIDRSREAMDACYAADEDAASVLSRAEQRLFELSGEQRSGAPPWPDQIKEVMREIERIYTTHEPATGLSTGYPDLDGVTGGMKSGEMIILAARPSQGKTSLALNIAEHVAGEHSKTDPQPHPVAVFSLEMSSDQLVRRMLCSHARVPSHKLAGGFLSEISHGDLVQAADALMKTPIFLDDSAGLDVLELRARARRLKRKHDIALVVVDYLQLLHYPQKGREGRQLETSAISAALKSMAKELKVPVLVLSQLSRAPETRDRMAVPKLSDLRDSGSIEQDADIVLLLRRPCKYPGDVDEHDTTLASVEVAKNRNGPTGKVKLNFFEEYTRFDSRIEGVDGGTSMQEEQHP